MKRQRVVAIYRQYKKPFDAYFLRDPIAHGKVRKRLGGKLPLLSSRVNNRPKAHGFYTRIGSTIALLKMPIPRFSIYESSCSS